eukprot:CAMPEP_0167746988 /NCGR_PEP_ID=MMETSP0110_2-20121227/4022_1 /TAXON_ID=629695 /ORGANISM="Gymnochlora sp., Strain CCMP2014" /LENGTH=801 /DNA_ID=CAMNT_0007631821 /DNA_START=111 /DNA_END=2516 /DNA_ORIENTATION=-
MPFIVYFIAFLVCFERVEGTLGNHAKFQSKIQGSVQMDIRVAGYRPKENDEYKCVPRKLDFDLAYATQFEAVVEHNNAHHMLVIVCGDIPAASKTAIDNGDLEGSMYTCREMGACSSPAIIWGSKYDGDKFQTPTGVGFPLGKSTSKGYVVLQVHYKDPIPLNLPPDRSGVTIQFSKTMIDNPISSAGMLMMVHESFAIPPREKSTLIPMECCYDSPTELEGFAYRVHAHHLGRSNKFKSYHLNETYEFSRSPQKPQIFVSIDKKMTIKPKTLLRGSCDYDSSNRSMYTYVGFTRKDEMCNVYLMLTRKNAMEASQKSLYEYMCAAGYSGSFMQYPGMLNGELSLRSYPMRTGIPGIPTYEEYASLITSKPEKILVRPTTIPEEPKEKLPSPFGHVSAVDVDEKGRIWIFCRRDRMWDANTFTNDNRIRNKTPIRDATILRLFPSGILEKAYGEGIFVMPHGLTLAKRTVWVTDVGLHQALEVSATTGKILRTIGTRFEPGTGKFHLCKPTDVAISGDKVFVTTGYCDDRVAVFRLIGQYVEYVGRLKYGLSKRARLEMKIPHTIDLDPCGRPIVASRESGQIWTFSLKSGKAISIVSPESYDFSGAKIYAAKYLSGGTIIAAVQVRGIEGVLKGMLVHLTSEGRLINRIPTSDGFTSPHDIAIGKDGTLYVAECGGDSPGRLLIFSAPGTSYMENLKLFDAPSAQLNLASFGFNDSHEGITRIPGATWHPVRRLEFSTIFNFIILAMILVLVWYIFTSLKSPNRRASPRRKRELVDHHDTDCSSFEKQHLLDLSQEIDEM